MTRNERILENAKATMRMEGFQITKEDEKLANKCLTGELSYADAIANLVKEYTQSPMMRH